MGEREMMPLPSCFFLPSRLSFFSFIILRFFSIPLFFPPVLRLSGKGEGVELEGAGDPWTWSVWLSHGCGWVGLSFVLPVCLPTNPLVWFWMAHGDQH